MHSSHSIRMKSAGNTGQTTPRKSQVENDNGLCLLNNSLVGIRSRRDILGRAVWYKSGANERLDLGKGREE